MNWVEVGIETTTEAVEAVANILYEAGVSGVVIQDPRDLLNRLGEDEWDCFELPADFDPEVAIIKAYLPVDSALAEKIREIRYDIEHLSEFNINKGSGTVKITEISEEDWAESWKKYYKPLRIGKSLVIKPTWETYKPQSNDIIIEMDPGMAFGTGTHETTVMCLELLENVVKKEQTILDIGCGSGILSIAGALLGASRVTAIDVDPVAIEVAEHNIRFNHVEDVVAISQGNLLQNAEGKYDIVVANISADAIIKLSKDINRVMKAGSGFIASGIIRERNFEVRDTLERSGFDIIDEKQMGEWVAYLAVPAYTGE
jgi:ribosomal protein L11 methyltransferase